MQNAVCTESNRVKQLFHIRQHFHFPEMIELRLIDWKIRKEEIGQQNCLRIELTRGSKCKYLPAHSFSSSLSLYLCLFLP